MSPAKREFVGDTGEDREWRLPLHYVSLAVIIVFSVWRPPIFAHRLLLLLAALVPVVVTTMAWVAPRFLLIPMWTQAILITCLAHLVLGFIPESRRTFATVLSAGMLVFMMAHQWHPVDGWYAEPPLAHVQEVSSFLRCAGIWNIDGR